MTIPETQTISKMDDVEICFVIHRRTYIADVKILQQAMKFQ